MTYVAAILAVLLYLAVGFITFLVVTLGSPSQPTVLQKVLMLPYTALLALIKQISK